jgi:hypothetical protein
MIGLMFFGALIAWGLFAFWLSKNIPVWFKFKYPTIAAVVLVPLLFLLPVADELIAYPQMQALCASLKPYEFAAGMDEKKAFGRTVYHKRVTAQEVIWPKTVKVTRIFSTYVDATTKEPILIESWLVPSRGMLGISNGSSGGKMTALLNQCSPVAQYDAAGLPLQFKSLNLTEIPTP